MRFLATVTGAAEAQPLHLDMSAPCQRNTADTTCVVDGNSIWLHGENIGIKDFVTPEPQTNICGGEVEVALAASASARPLELLNGNEWTIERYGYERGGRGDRRALIDAPAADR